MKELSQLNICRQFSLLLWNHPKEKEMLVVQTSIFLYLVFESRNSAIPILLTSLDFCLQFVRCSETFLIIFLHLKFLSLSPFPFLFFSFKSCSILLAIFRNIFIILFMPQATKATPSFSLLPAFYTLYLYCLLLICSLPWFD